MAENILILLTEFKKRFLNVNKKYCVQQRVKIIACDLPTWKFLRNFQWFGSFLLS